ncbi:reverse transcriptase domain-containing protein [Tanacetum coccineum]
MMIATTAFIRGEAAAAGKKKGHASWKAQDQSKRHASERSSGTEGPLVIEEEIGGHTIHRMYVDGGSSTEVLYEHCFNRLWLEIKNQMVPATTSLTGFSGETIWPLGQLWLLVTIGDADHSTKAWMNFMIVRSLSPYNGIIGRPGIREIQEVPSTTHRMLKFPVDGGIVTIRSTILIPAECATVITSSKEIPKEAEVHHENFKVALHSNFPDQEVSIRGMLFAKGRKEVCSLLKKNLDIFAWQPSDMTGVPRLIAEHRLNIREGYSPVRHKKRGQAPERAKAIQAEMSESDEEKIAFHTCQGVYCYTKIPFGLKNAGATYQRLVDKAFDSQVGRNIEVYVDDLVIKSHTEAEMLRDIDETFSRKSCPDKTKAVLQLPSPQTIKEVQSLNGKLASLNRFLSKSAEKSLPLFKTLKKCIKKSDFHWTPEAEQAFKQLKQHLSELPLLVAPKPKEELIVYLSASYGAVSAVLMTERGTAQTPVYFVSRALQGPELNYAPMEKLVLSLVFAAKRLRRTSVKGQILADFLVEKPDESPPDASVVETPQEPWTLFTDGSSCVDGSGAGLILTSPEGTEFTYALRFQFTASNNEAEYEALIAGLRIAAQMGVRNVHVSVDSKLVANQVLGTYVAKEENMVKYLEKAKSLISGFANFSISQVPRSKNKKTNALSKIASTSFAHLSKQEARDAWGTDIVGPFPEGPGKVNFLIVAMDYFTKWIEAKAVATITGSQVKKFVWDNIVCRFGLPGEIVSDNGKQFSDNPFKDWSLGEGIKSHLGEGNKNWIEELPYVLWAHRTMIKSSHGDTPFLLTYGTKTVIPVEIGMPTYDIAVVDAVHNDEELRLNMDLLEERPKAKAKLKMTKYYIARVRGVTFRLGDFVYRSNDASHAVDGGKLGLNWEGPYEVTEALGDGAYKLRSMDGNALLRTWNIANLKKCYL